MANLEDYIKARQELRCRCQCLNPDNDFDAMDNLMLIKYVQAKVAGKEFDCRHFARWARIVKGSRYNVKGTRNSIHEEVVGSDTNDKGVGI